MTKNIMKLVPNIVKKYNIIGKTLDIGAYSVNGCLRKCFSGEYVGLDIVAGWNVDVVASSHDMPFKDKTFNCVVTADMLEHDSDPFKTAKEAMRVLRVGGHAIIIAPFKWPIHNFPKDYFRYTPDGLKILFKDLKCLETYMSGNHSVAIFKKIK